MSLMSASTTFLVAALLLLSLVQAAPEDLLKKLPKKLKPIPQEDIGLKKEPGHKCIHDEIINAPWYKGPEQINVKYNPARRSNQTADSFLEKNRNGENNAVHLDKRKLDTLATYSNMRIKVVFDPSDGSCSSGTCGHCKAVGDVVPTFSGGATVTCTAADVLTATKKDYMMNILMKSAAEWLQTALRVNPVVGNLIVTKSTCGNSPGVPIPSTDSSTGQAATDFIAYVTAVPSADPTSATVAWATACLTDQNGRPLVGHVNWIPSSLSNADSGNVIKEDDDIATGVHEIMHALGFSASFFGNYITNDGSATAKTDGLLSQQSTTLGKGLKKIISPRVVAQARTYFGCATMDGLEIEDQGGAGTAGSHWEKRLMYQELMSGISSTVKSFKSMITLAYFEDTGHYEANYLAADFDMNWGKGHGCTFVNEKCSHADNKMQEEFCFKGDEACPDTRSLQASDCTRDRLGRGYCDFACYASAIPTEFQYYSGNAVGGAGVQMADFCPAILAFSNRICTDPSNKDSQNIYGQKYGRTSRCFYSNLLDANYPSLSSLSARCFAFSCASTGAILLTVAGVTVRCPADGSAGVADLSSLNGAFTGQINCPASDVMCATVVPTTAPPPTTPLPPGQTWPPDYVTRPAATPLPALPNACADRAPCADGLENLMPACRQLAVKLVECFGTNCDSEMKSWMSARNFVDKCGDPMKFQDECQEGAIGAYDVCDLTLGVGQVVPSLTLLLLALAMAIFL